MKRAYAEEDIEQPEATMIEACQQATDLTASESELEIPELEIPEVFDLRPLSTRRVIVKVRNRGPAPFYFVEDDDVKLEDIED
jgi:hypothetical protein